MFRDAFEEAVSLEDGPLRVAALAAWLQSLFGEAHTLPILVGGGAVELYTGGAYRTGDLDFVGTTDREVTRRLEEVGFSRHGRHWVHEAEQVFLEFPGSDLAAGERSATIVVGPYEVRVVGLEELIVDRLAAWQFWNSEIDGINAYLLSSVSTVEVDIARLRSLADVASLGKALDQLEGFVASHEGRQPPLGELEAWARRALRGHE